MIFIAKLNPYPADHDNPYPCKHGDNLHKMSKPFFWEKNKKNISKCCLLKFLPRVLSIKQADQTV